MQERKSARLNNPCTARALQLRALTADSLYCSTDVTFDKVISRERLEILKHFITRVITKIRA